MPSGYPPSVIATACLVSAALLWLGAELSAEARLRSRPLFCGLTGAGAVLVGCGVWWPGHMMPATDSWSASIGYESLYAWGLALAWSISGIGTAACARQKALPALGAMVVVGAMVAYVHAMMVTPQVFRLALAGTPGGPGLSLLLLTSALVAIHVELTKSGVVRVVRAFAALVAAVVLSLIAAASLPEVSASASSPSEGLLLVGLLALAALLLFVLKRAGAAESAAWRPSARAATSLDSLTQLPTRVFFEMRLASAARACSSKKGRGLALLFIDLDGFKPVNDTFGHSCGDQVLEQVGKRLRAMSGRSEVAARVGGDEFLFLLTEVSSQDAVARTAARLIHCLSRPYRVEDREITISCSVGIALYPDTCSHTKLIARADAAMYSAKRAGGASHCFYSPALDADAQETFELLRDLRQALTRDEFELLYQPKIDAKTGLVTAAEALLRWQHPTRGLVLPGVFIPVAERFGLIGAIGDWVITDACRQAREWRDRGLRMRVAINLSAHQMRQDDIADRIAEALQQYRIHPSLLTCEITETAAMEDTKATQETFRRLGELGAHLSIDDFGTGYSSLSYLRQLPAEELKIDRSFVMDLEHSPDARAVVDAVVKLAHALGLKVVAEGVENPRQQQVLAELGCDELQGYLFARPMSARALLMWAMRDRSESAAFRASLFGETREGLMV
jgi:diguanylate cyclase (GGDEF)-like protein